MNRQQRRQAAKQTPAYRRGMGAEALIREMSKNGITPDQYDRWGEKQYEKGWHDGFTAAGEEITKCLYAVACLTLKEAVRIRRSEVYAVPAGVGRKVFNQSAQFGRDRGGISGDGLDY